jgi:hypothetical protein
MLSKKEEEQQLYYLLYYRFMRDIKRTGVGLVAQQCIERCFCDQSLAILSIVVGIKNTHSSSKYSIKRNINATRMKKYNERPPLERFEECRRGTGWGGGELPHNLLDDEHAHYFPSHHFSSLFESFIRFYIKGESIWTDWRMKPLK